MGCCASVGRVTGAVIAMFVLAGAGEAFAQAPDQPLPLAGFQDGFFVQSANGDNRLLFGFVGQMDGRFSIDDPPAITNTFAIRKVRPTFSGRVAKYFDFKIMPDFGGGTSVLVDAYFDVRFSPKFRVRAGKDKTPVGYESLIGDAFLLFPERSQASNLLPGRDVGVQVQGDLSPKVFYAAGVVNGVVDGTNSTTDIDTNNGKDMAGRIVVQPFRTAATGATPAGALSGLGFQIRLDRQTERARCRRFERQSARSTSRARAAPGRWQTDADHAHHLLLLQVARRLQRAPDRRSRWSTLA